MTLNPTQACLLEIQRLEIQLNKLRKAIRFSPDAGQRSEVHLRLREAKIAINAAEKEERRR